MEVRVTQKTVFFQGTVKISLCCKQIFWVLRVYCRFSWCVMVPWCFLLEHPLFCWLTCGSTICWFIHLAMVYYIKA